MPEPARPTSFSRQALGRVAFEAVKRDKNAATRRRFGPEGPFDRGTWEAAQPAFQRALCVAAAAVAEHVAASYRPVVKRLQLERDCALLLMTRICEGTLTEAHCALIQKILDEVEAREPEEAAPRG
jgi:hypothetical protein